MSPCRVLMLQIILLSLFVVSVPAGGSALPALPMDARLVVVEDPPDDCAESLISEGIIVLRDMGGFLIVAATTDEVALLSGSGISLRDLGASVTDGPFYTVGTRSGFLAAALPEGARHLYSGERDLVVAMSSGEAEIVSAAGHDIAKVFLRPIRPMRRPDQTLKKFDVAFDSRVNALVSAVSSSQVDQNVQRLQEFKTRYARHDSCRAAAAWIAAQFLAAGIDSVYYQFFDHQFAENVVAVIPGAEERDALVVIGGHYDSVTGNQNNAPGADDNASGTSCVLEVARALAGERFKKTVVFVAFGAEEMGLLGSEAFAYRSAQRGDNIVATIAVDMIGYRSQGDTRDLDIVANPASAWIKTLAMDVGGTYVQDLPVVGGSLPGGASSDHASFWAAGYPAILLFEDTENYSPYIHSANDRVGISYNDPTLADRSVRVATALVATLAEPYDVAIDHSPLTHTSDTQGPHRVVATITAAAALDPAALQVHWSANGGALSEAVLTPTGTPDEFEAFLPAQPGGTTLNYWIAAADGSGNSFSDPIAAPASTHSFFVGAITEVVVDDFENESGWTAGVAGDDATEGIWERVDPNGTWFGPVPVQPEDDNSPGAGKHCFVTGNAAPGAGQRANEVDGGVTTLLSPTYDLSGLGDAAVRYHRWYSNDTGFHDPESWVVDGSDDGGQTWVRFETSIESDHSWRFVEIPLTGKLDLTGAVQFRFIAADHGNSTIVEAGVDDFSIVEFESPSTGVETAESIPGVHPVLVGASPNPLASETRIAFHLPAPQKVSLGVYAPSGRLVRTLVQDRLPAGDYTGSRAFTWDGTNDSGREVSSGVYFYRFEAGRVSETRKVTILK